MDDPARSSYHVSLILTLTINPAIDRTIISDRIAFEDRGYILSRGEAAGGRGVNASQVIHTFGGKTLALLTSGGEIGKRMEHFMAKMGFPFEVVRVHAESRANLTISDKQGLTIKLNEIGAPLEENEVAAVRDLVDARLKKASWLMICGSTQPGVPGNFYSELIQLAKSRGVHTMLDADGEALNHALEAVPSVISPNQQEAERLLGRAIITRSQSLEAVKRIHDMGPEIVILSLGSKGALAASKDGILEDPAAAHRSTLSHRCGRRAGSRICLGNRKEEALCRCGPLGCGGGHCDRFSTWDELPDFGSDQGHL